MNNNGNKEALRALSWAFAEACAVLNETGGREHVNPSRPFITAPAIPGRLLASRACVRFAGCAELNDCAGGCNFRCAGGGRSPQGRSEDE
jgi:hypothetical protein